MNKKLLEDTIKIQKDIKNYEQISVSSQRQQIGKKSPPPSQEKKLGKTAKK